jgi:hypothetical protein
MFHVRCRNRPSECDLVESKETESSESENANIADENDDDCIFYAKGKQTLNGTSYKGMVKRLVARVNHIRSEFREGGSWHFLHDFASAHSSVVFPEFLAKRGTQCYHIHTTPPI